MVSVQGGVPFADAVWTAGHLASDAVAAFAEAIESLVAEIGTAPRLVVDRMLVGEWFRVAVRPAQGSPPNPWDPIAGDYPGQDGWIRLHTNAPRHRRAALRVLGVPAERAAVAAAVSGARVEELETAVVAAGGAAAAMHTAEAWARHPQGAAVTGEPLVAAEGTARFDAATSRWRPSSDRPLGGLRVLDLTRVLAGPVATRALAAYGADVLRIDPPDWDEPAVVTDMTIGKRVARLDASTDEGRARLVALLASADVLVHGYRRDALEALGLGDAERVRIRPGLVDVALTAYGWTGPWSDRRGFDSLVQMSTGIADRGMRVRQADRPVPLPEQALDHATGWLMAAAVVRGLRDRLRDGCGTTARLSLARTAAELRPSSPESATAAAPPASARVATPWGPHDLVAFPIDGIPARFERGPAALGSDPAEWP